MMKPALVVSIHARLGLRTEVFLEQAGRDAEPQPTEFGRHDRTRIARHHGVEEGDIFDTAGQDADGVEQRRHRGHALGRIAAERRAVADDAAQRGRNPDRAGAVGAERRRNDAGRDGGGASGTRPAGKARWIARIGDGTEHRAHPLRPEGQFVHVGLAEYDHAGTLEATDDRGILRRHE
jgi:hypothetical protein